jgi:SAM-dependent methyltransferase
VSIASGIVAYSAAVADLPFSLPSPYDDALLDALDVEGKIPRALEALGPIEGRDVAVVAPGPREIAQLTELGGRPMEIDSLPSGGAALPDASFDVVTARWMAFRDANAEALAAADRLLRPGGRLLAVHDYGRDDVSRLRGDLPEYGIWSRRDGPFLSAGFRIRVIHCFWTFPDTDAAAAFVRGAFPATGEAVAAGLRRPRLSYNVAVYHRTLGDVAG